MLDVGDRLTFEQMTNSKNIIVEFLKVCTGFRVKGFISPKYEEVLLETGGIRHFNDYDQTWTAYEVTKNDLESI